MLWGATVALLAACTDGSPSEARASGAYEAVIRWFAASAGDDPEPLPVFVEPRGEGTTIDLQVQAEVVAATADVANVRFIDARDEALVVVEPDSSGGGSIEPETSTPRAERMEVRDGGVLIRLGPVLEEGSRVTLDVDVWNDDETTETKRFVLRADGAEWVVVG